MNEHREITPKKLLEDVRTNFSLEKHKSISGALQSLMEVPEKAGIVLHSSFRSIGGENYRVGIERNSLKYGKDSIAVDFLFTLGEIRSAPESIRMLLAELELNESDEIKTVLILKNIGGDIDDKNGHQFDLRFEVGRDTLERGKSGFYITSDGKVGLIPTPTENPYRSELERKNNRLIVGGLNTSFGDMPHPYAAQLLIDAVYMVGSGIEARKITKIDNSPID